MINQTSFDDFTEFNTTFYNNTTFNTTDSNDQITNHHYIYYKDIYFWCGIFGVILSILSTFITYILFFRKRTLLNFFNTFMVLITILLVLILSVTLFIKSGSETPVVIFWVVYVIMLICELLYFGIPKFYKFYHNAEFVTVIQTEQP